MLGIIDLDIIHINVRIVLIVGVAKSIRIGLLLSLSARLVLVEFELLHLLVERLVELLVIELNLFLEVFNPFLGNIWNQFTRQSASAPAISPLMTQIYSLQTSLSALWLKLFLEQL